MYAILTKADGRPTLGSDGKIWIDGRFGHCRILEVVRNYRDGFKDNFPGKYADWVCYGIVASLRDDPSTTYLV